MARCTDCGLVALRQSSPPALVECTESLRQGGFQGLINSDNAANFFSSADDVRDLDKGPICAVGAFDLAAEFRVLEEALLDRKSREKGGILFFGTREWIVQESRLSTIGAERECQRFVQWQPGLSPQEHLRMQAEAQAEQREDERDREMRAREDARDRRVEELQRGMHRTELVVMGGAVTLAIVLSSIIAAILEGAISSGWEPRWWPF